MRFKNIEKLISHEQILADSIGLMDNNTLINLLKMMIKIREVELKLASERKNGTIGGPVHLAVGQEAIATGISYSLNKTDYVFGAHRSHPHIIALGLEPYKLFCEVLGRVSGCSRGMGGSMHLIDQSIGFYGSVPIVTGTVPLALGAAIASKMRNTNDIAVAYLGDGAAEEGVFHESLNLAKLLNAPILFVVENNFYASHMYITERQPSYAVSRFAEANKIPYSQVNGNNVLEVLRKSSSQINAIREGGGPFLLEAFTYRWLGHVDWRDDIDVGVTRSIEEVDSWKLHDPIINLKKILMENNVISSTQFDSFKSGIVEKINSDWDLALDSQFPESTQLLDCVYYK